MNSAPSRVDPQRHTNTPLLKAYQVLQNPPKKAICGIDPKLCVEKHKKKLKFSLLVLAKKFKKTDFPNFRNTKMPISPNFLK